MRDTQIVRNILREQGADSFGFIATNKYKNCRTVKSYVPNDKLKNTLKRVENRIKEERVPASVKAIPSFLPGSRYSSLIVRLPLTY